jgi:hypothetical protein
VVVSLISNNYLRTLGIPLKQGNKLPDCKTGEVVSFLFLIRNTAVGKSYINRTLIPALCRKAGVPLADVRGNITTHRARSTIASQLFNAKSL